MPELLDMVKTALRIKTAAFDEAEILPLIEAAKADLLRSGIAFDAHPNAVLCRRAVVVYCRLNFGEPVDPDRLDAVYEKLKAFLSTGGGGVGG